MLKFKLEFLVKLAKMKMKGEALAKLSRLTGQAESQKEIAPHAKHLAISFWNEALFSQCRRRFAKYRVELKHALGPDTTVTAQLEYLDAQIVWHLKYFQEQRDGLIDRKVRDEIDQHGQLLSKQKTKE